MEDKLIKMFYFNICSYNLYYFYIHYTVCSFVAQDFYIFAHLSSPLTHQYLSYNNKTMLLFQEKNLRDEKILKPGNEQF